MWSVFQIMVSNKYIFELLGQSIWNLTPCHEETQEGYKKNYNCRLDERKFIFAEDIFKIPNTEIMTLSNIFSTYISRCFHFHQVRNFLESFIKKIQIIRNRLIHYPKNRFQLPAQILILMISIKQTVKQSIPIS